MAPQTEFVSKTQHYLKVKKPMLERQRRARMNKCLDTLKELIAEFQGNDAILRMDKAEMLESALEFMKVECKKPIQPISKIAVAPMDSFRNGYMNAVNEVSRVMAGTPGMSVNMGKAVMTHLGSEFNRLLHTQQVPQINTQLPSSNSSVSSSKAPLSPASSGYCSDSEDRQSVASPAAAQTMWRPW
ncbi:enhancer of split m5 protein [Lucilia sericata]|uniref:enhancer of split m5 protein n=1 Tax=Lucilia sericata TaxID=13632 RepID=UPI0018A85EED|nr:enhancer of split m5 protein [Lucilia sericata]